MMNIGRPPVFSTSYDRAACDIGIVHLGYGAFHRAHQAVYVDDYMDRTGDLGWGIAAVNLRASESDEFTFAQASDEGYLLKSSGNNMAADYRLVRPHIAFADWSQDADAAEALVALDTVHAISITVTESGYYLDDSGDLNPNDTVISAELSGDAPRSVYGYLAAALARRMQGCGLPVTIICCDNIRGNGHMLKRNLLAYLAAVGKDMLADWVAAHAAFPCSMVDRITPRSTPALQTEIDTMFPVATNRPVHSEDYIQWVLQREFAGPMPDLGKVGVEVVADVDPYEEAKIRILNGGHTGLAYLAALAGHDTFDQAMHDPVLRQHFDYLVCDEILPGIQIDLPFDRMAYSSLVAERFANKAIADALERICMDGFSKFPIFLRPTLEGCLAQGLTPSRTYASIASWYVFARRHMQGQGRIAYHEPNGHLLKPLLADGAQLDFARSSLLWADLPETYGDFASQIVTAIQEMDKTWPV